MKFLLLTFTVTLLLVTVITTAQTRNYQLTVRYGQKNFPSKLYLHYDNKTDSAIERNGTFVFKGKLQEPVRAILREPLSRSLERKELFLNNENILVTVFDSIQNSKVSNSTINDLSAAYEAHIRNTKSLYDSLSLMLRSTDNKEMKDSLRPIVRKAYSDLQEEELSFIRTNPGSWMSLLALQSLVFDYSIQNVDSVTAAMRFSPLRSLYNQLDANIRQSATGVQVERKLSGLLNSQVGQPVMPFAQAGHDGKMVSTADHKGKYFLIDFWGSWCVWCRKGHPHLKELYDRYKPKGFEIIAISKEFGEPKEQVENWLKAIEKDGIHWKHIMIQPENDLTETYGISAYPTKFLINPAGKIILRVGDDNEKKLDQILNDIYK